MLRISGFICLIFAVAVVSFEHHHDHDHEPPHHKYSKEANTGHSKVTGVHLTKHNLRTESPEQLWLEIFGSVLLISLAPFLLLHILPDLSKHPNLLKIFLAFAAGGLLGDAFLHLIPHAVDSGHSHSGSRSGTPNVHDHDHDHKRHMVVGLSVVSGIFIFLCIEKLIRVVHHQRGTRGHSHSGPSGSTHSTASFSSQNRSKKDKKSANSDDTSQKRDKKPTVVVREFRVAGYLNLAADFTHNFTDGLAIGASFLMSRHLGIITTLTVLFHELPHEIGDYAILIQSGCSARKAMFLQLSTALGAAIGASLSLFAAGVGGFGSMAKFEVPLLTEDIITGCVLPFTAGGFIYIAMTSVLPDLLSSTEETDSKRVAGGVFKRILQSTAEVLSLVTGIAMMAALGSME